MSESVCEAVKVIFFDAAGTLIHVAQPVGVVYAKIAADHGIGADPDGLEKGFRIGWKTAPAPGSVDGGRSEDDDRGWWRALVDRTFAEQGHPVSDALFDDLYAHYGRADAWSLYPDVEPVLKALHGRYRLWMLSNFDRRLYSVLEGLGIAGLLDGVVVSSEVGASKPERRIFDVAASSAKAQPAECWHVGDEEKADYLGAQSAGMNAYWLRRPEYDLWRFLAELEQTRSKKVF